MILAHLRNSPSPPPQKRPRLAQLQFNPIKVASPEAAATVDADPPLPKLLKVVKEAVNNPPRGSAVVYWMRMSDLRLNDNRALSLAAQQAAHEEVPLLALFVLSPEDYVAHDRGSRRIDFTLRNLKTLKRSLSELNIPLYTITHTPRRTLPSQIISLLVHLGCTSIYGNIEYEIDELRRDIAMCESAKHKSIQVIFVHNKCVIDPGLLLTKQHKPYTVFSPYHRKWIAELDNNIHNHLKDHEFNHSNSTSTRSSDKFSFLFDNDIPDVLPGFELSPAQGKLMADIWPAGEDAAKAILHQFLHTKARVSQLGAVDPLTNGAEKTESGCRVMRYADDRDRVDSDTTSRLSVYLSSGVLSARTCIRESMSLQQSHKVDGRRESGVGRWLQEIAWRDFYTHILAAFPRLSMGRPYLEKFAAVVWENHQAFENVNANADDSAHTETVAEILRKWKEGRTGVPIVDAAMRCIKEMGWVHNRLRMISAMYLTKDLMIDWRVGERHFMKQLIDGDFASNNGGWQWCASTGVDPCPYFRIFNPYSQSLKVDPDGAFIKYWVPELRELTGSEIHNPPTAIADKLGYPKPVIEHGHARERALRRYKSPGKL
ncbi:hypothetical protein AX15_007613 [Amanita polypyramis BW_CC]|nr:hypothetical protein AX15_007613 [Amanita polypyramis BW_CC]